MRSFLNLISLLDSLSVSTYIQCGLVALIKCPADRIRFEIRQAHIALRLSG